jgi:hypothetical protein
LVLHPAASIPLVVPRLNSLLHSSNQGTLLRLRASQVDHSADPAACQCLRTSKPSLVLALAPAPQVSPWVALRRVCSHLEQDPVVLPRLDRDKDSALDRRLMR